MGYTQRDLDERLEKYRSRAIVHCRMVRDLAGGQPASEKAIRQFAIHYLKLKEDSKELDEAVARILKEEIGERDTTEEGGELTTEEVYQVTVLRRSKHGPHVLEHMVKAMIKQAATRLDLFNKKRGSKGDVAELGTVYAYGESLQDPARPWQIHLLDDQGNQAVTRYEKISGSVQTPQGRKSIQHHTEVAPEGTCFSFELRWPARKLLKGDMMDIIAAATQVGLGSCQSLGYGRFEVLDLDFEMQARAPEKDEKAGKVA
jgi:hypothetical protein